MEKEKPPGHGPGGGLPPPSPRHIARPVSASGGGDFSVKGEASPSPPAPGEHESARFSHDVSRMPDFPRRRPGHRRAHSEILGLPDDISFDHDFGVVGSADGPSLSDDIEEDSFSMYIDTEKFPSPETSELMAMQGGESSGTTGGVIGAAYGDYMGSGSNGRPKVRHQHSQSMDGTSSIKSELLTSVGEGTNLADTKKALSASKLADLTLIDPKRAKRILANRQSAARSKERKMRYISELERKVQTLQTEATTLSAQLTLLQRDSDGLTAENNELKIRLQTMEQQVHLQDALNVALREEVQRLKLMTGQVISNGNQIINFGSSYGSTPQFYAHNHSVQSLLAAQQLQQLQIHSQHQQQPHSYQHHGSQQASININIREPTSSESQNQN